MLKRIFDIVFAMFAMLVLLPVMVLTAVAVRFKLGSPIFFVQERPGRYGRSFRMMKFRTMLNLTGKSGNLLSDDQRLTGFGNFLRSTSLDELPELINVLRGEMSIVGPRPLLMEYLPLYSSEQSRRHEVRPGITGWAQVNGRNCVDWPERFKMDVWYVDNHTLLLDLKIIHLTVRQVMNRKEVSQDGHVTMSKFRGNK